VNTQDIEVGKRYWFAHGHDVYRCKVLAKGATDSRDGRVIVKPEWWFSGPRLIEAHTLICPLPCSGLLCSGCR